jgi:AcrR family transcriptional regulator
MPTTAVHRRPRRAGRNRFEVLAATCRVIARRGVEQTRFADVSAEAGVPISTLQYYFGSREDMIIAAFDHAWSNERDELARESGRTSDPWERIRGLVVAGIDAFTGANDLRGRLWLEGVRLGIRDPETRTEVLGDYESWRGLLSEAIAAGLDSGAFTSSLSPDDVAVLALAMIDGTGLPLALQDPRLAGNPPAELVLRALAVLLGLPEPKRARR